MTEYEIASLFSQINGNIASLLTNFITILSLYLGAGYLIAHRLTKGAAITFTCIFVLMYVGFCLGLLGALRQLMGRSQEIQTFAAQGKGLAWHPLAASPAWLQYAPLIVSVVNLSIVLVGAIYFFFSSRRQHLHAVASATAQTLAVAP